MNEELEKIMLTMLAGFCAMGRLANPRGMRGVTNQIIAEDAEAVMNALKARWAKDEGPEYAHGEDDASQPGAA